MVGSLGVSFDGEVKCNPMWGAPEVLRGIIIIIIIIFKFMLKLSLFFFFETK